MDGGGRGEWGEGRGIRGGLLHGAVLRLRPAAMKFQRTVPRDPELAAFLCPPVWAAGPSWDGNARSQKNEEWWCSCLRLPYVRTSSHSHP